MIWWSVRLSLRSPLRSSRWRVVWPEEAGIGAAPARRAKAASLTTRPWCDQESTTWAARSGPMPGSSSSCGASARVSFSISRGQLAFFFGEPLNAPRDGFECKVGAAQLGVLPAIGSCFGEAAEEPSAGERAKLAAQRFGGGDEKVAQLAERRRSRGHGSFAGCHKRS